MKKWGLLLILLLSLLPRTTFAEETADAICIEGETEGLDTDAVDAATEEMDAGVSFSDLLAEILSGEFDFTFANIKEKAYWLNYTTTRAITVLRKAFLYGPARRWNLSILVS